MYLVIYEYQFGFLLLKSENGRGNWRVYQH